MWKVQDEPDCAADGEDSANPDQADVMIISPEKETNDGNDKRGEQKLNRQAESRSERDPNEPASAEVDERHNRADPRLIILALFLLMRGLG
jgi:hypothetical protein